LRSAFFEAAFVFLGIVLALTATLAEAGT